VIVLRRDEHDPATRPLGTTLAFVAVDPRGHQPTSNKHVPRPQRTSASHRLMMAANDPASELTSSAAIVGVAGIHTVPSYVRLA